MLSRVAESLYWMSRYIERAEDLTRLLAVNFNALLDLRAGDAQTAWQSLVKATGDDALFAELHGEANAQSVTQFMVWEPLNPNSITACIIRARENARSVREQITSEMWEGLNRLYFLTRNVERPSLLTNPAEFFRLMRDRAQAFQGITTATMSHGESYHFIQLGLHLERADKTARILDGKYLYLHQLPESSAETSLQLIALLRSCSAFEPYRRASAGQINVINVVEYLLLDREFPRAVLFCLNSCLQTLDLIGEDVAASPRSNPPRRALGRLAADLEYLDIQDVLGENMDPFLRRFLVHLNSIGDDISRLYFNTSVILPDERPRQQQQQQQ
ncbi:MAG TPA: alpha-E domain-containing protein [Anaerolineales bacterium]|nr:alpha-E domain-containing protein [Anaerolineales bacterium]